MAIEFQILCLVTLYFKVSLLQCNYTFEYRVILTHYQSKVFCFFLHYNTHYITYFITHLFLCILAPPIVVSVLLTCQDPEYKTTAFFHMYFQEKNIVLYLFGSIRYA